MCAAFPLESKRTIFNKEEWEEPQQRSSWLGKPLWTGLWFPAVTLLSWCLAFTSPLSYRLGASQRLVPEGLGVAASVGPTLPLCSKDS